MRSIRIDTDLQELEVNRTADSARLSQGRTPFDHPADAAVVLVLAAGTGRWLSLESEISMIDRSNRLLALGVLYAALVSAPANAEPPPSQPGGPAKRGHGEARAADDKGPERREHAKAGEKPKEPSGVAERGEHGGVGRGKEEDANAHEAPHGRGEPADGRGRFRSGWGSLRDELRQSKLTKAQIEERLAKLRETSAERRATHREALKRRWGATLAKPSAREELGHHERRLAFLNRALLLAETEPKLAKQKDKLVERIETLITKENARHEKAMARFESAAPESPAPEPPPAPADAKGAKK